MFKEIPIEAKTDSRGQQRTLIHGKGINDVPYRTSLQVNGRTYSCPYYLRWVGMLTRCYSPRWLKKHPTYVGTEVCKEWLSLMAFKQWMMTQDWKGKQLDKDLLGVGNKIYSPSTCLFVSPQVNSFFSTGRGCENILPVGMYLRNGKYEVGVSEGKGKRKWVGAYTSIDEAMNAYLAAKSHQAKQLLKMEKDPRVRQAIVTHLEYFTDRYKCLKTVY